MTKKQEKQLAAYVERARKHLKWVAVDEDGRVHAFHRKPEVSNLEGAWATGFVEKAYLGRNRNFAQNWRETLTSVELEEPSTCDNCWFRKMAPAGFCAGGRCARIYNALRETEAGYEE